MRNSADQSVTLQQDLLLLLQVLHDLDIDLEHVGHDVRRRQGEPLCQRDVRHAVALVDLDPDELLGVGGVFNVVACSMHMVSM